MLALHLQRSNMADERQGFVCLFSERKGMNLHTLFFFKNFILSFLSGLQMPEYHEMRSYFNRHEKLGEWFAVIKLKILSFLKRLPTV